MTETTKSFQKDNLFEQSFLTKNNKNQEIHTRIQYCYSCNVEVSKYTSKSEIDREIDLKNLPISVCENCMRDMLKPVNDFDKILSAYLKD